MTGPEYQAFSPSTRWVTLPREQWEQTLLCPGEYNDWRVQCPGEQAQYVPAGEVPTFAWDMAQMSAPPSVPVEQLISPPVGALPPIVAQPLEAVPAAAAVHLPGAPAVPPGAPAVAIPPAVAPAPMPFPFTRFLTQPFIACVLPAAAAVSAYAYRAGDELLTRAAIAAGAFFAAHAVIGRARNGVWSKPYDVCAPPGTTPGGGAAPATTAVASPQLAPVPPTVEPGGAPGAPAQNYGLPGGDVVA